MEEIENCDHAIRIMSNVLKLCSLEKSAAEVKLGHFMSPEVGCTLMWFLKRWCLSFLLPTEHFYQEVTFIFFSFFNMLSSNSNFYLKTYLILD